MELVGPPLPLNSPRPALGLGRKRLIYGNAVNHLCLLSYLIFLTPYGRPGTRAYMACNPAGFNV